METKIKATAVALSLALSQALPVHSALAEAVQLDKTKFSEGCRSGGNSFVDNRDGSFQCNLKDGGAIKCPDTKSQCSYVAPRLLPQWARPSLKSAQPRRSN